MESNVLTSVVRLLLIVVCLVNGSVMIAVANLSQTQRGSSTIQSIVNLDASTSDKVSYNGRFPVIGILAQSMSEDQGKAYIYADYVKYMEQSGALVVPVRVNQTDDYYTNLFQKLNGVVLPGGGRNLLTSGYSRSVKHFFDLSKQAYDKNKDIFPILGICWGFQELTARVAQADLLVHCDGQNLSLPVKFTAAAKTSRMFSEMPDYIYSALQKWNLTFNNHEYCMSTQVFSDFNPLKEFYRALSTNTLDDGVEFVSSIEAFNYPFYGVQWHPAKNAYWWSDANINHSSLAVQASQHISNFFVNEARKSNHSFDSLDELASLAIYNYQPVYEGAPTFYNTYYFYESTETDEKHATATDIHIWDWPQFSRIKSLGLSQILSFMLFLLMLMMLMIMLSSLVRHSLADPFFYQRIRQKASEGPQ